MRAILIGIALEVAMAAVAAAQQTNATVVPSLNIATVYDDNLFAKTTNGDAGAITLLRPSLEGLYESPKLIIQSLFSFDMQRSNHDALSSLDARRHGDFDLHQRATPKLTLGLGLRYDRTETPGELNLDTGILGERRIATRWEAVPSLVYHATPRTTVNASYNGMTETLIDDIRGVLHVLRGGVAHQTSTRDEFSVGYLGREFVDALEMHRSDAILVGWSRELGEGTRFTLQAGPRQSTGKSLATEALVGFTHNTNRLRLAMDYWHGETIILGIHGPVAVDTAAARMVWPVTPRTEIGLHTGITDSTTLANQNVRVYRAILLGAWTPHGGAYTLSASYGAEFQHGLIRQSLYIDDQVMRHTFRVNLTIAPRLSRTFRPTGEPPAVRPHGVAQ
jgi:hypothetical protein